MTDWPEVHEQVLATFRKGWDAPGPDAWDFAGLDTEFIQPMLRDGVGADRWREEVGRLIDLLPDVRADVRSWAAHEDAMFLEIEFTATLGGRPFGWKAVDRLTITPDGHLLRRQSFFDSAPLAQMVMRRPRAWPRWWRSGIAPLDIRRHVLRRRHPTRRVPS